MAGGGLAAVAVSHVVWASLIAASGLLLARRLMPDAAAVAFALGLAWSPAWHLVSQHLWSEATAAGLLFVLIAGARRGLASVPGALLLAALALLGWLTRPVLGVAVPALVLAAVLELGPRGALRSRPLWVFVGAFVLLHRAVVLSVEASIGFPPYAHYGVMAERSFLREVSLYQKDYVGWLAYLQQNAPAVIALLRANLVAYWNKVFQAPLYLHVGWLALPAVAYGFWRRGPALLERRFAALMALALTATALGAYGGYAPNRYPLPGAVCIGLLAAGFLAEAGQWLAGRLAPGAQRAARAGGALPLVLVLAVLGFTVAPEALRGACRDWEAWRENKPRTLRGRWDSIAWALCPHLDRDAVVASQIPWKIYFWCGNAGLAIPRDLETRGWLDRYLDEQQPGYLVSDGSPAFALLESSPRLERVASAGRHQLYRVVEPSPGSRPWQAPPPLSLLLPTAPSAGDERRRAG